MWYQVKFNRQSSQPGKIMADKQLNGRKKMTTNFRPRSELLWNWAFLEGTRWEEKKEVYR